MKTLVTANMVAGAFAMWATRQHPYGAPDDLVLMVRLLRMKMQESFSDGPEAFKMHKFTRAELTAWLRANMEQSILHWNRPRSGHNGIVSCSRFHEPKPEDDYIDLDALFGNITNTVFEECNASDIRAIKER